MAKDRLRVVTLPDAHCPFESQEAIEVAFNFLATIKPEIILLHEWHDFYDLSKFDKDPARANKLQEEIDRVTRYFWALRKICPRSRVILLKSNHLDRLRKYLWSQAPALASLRALEIEKLLCLDEFNIEYLDNFEYGGVLFKHGDIVRKFAGYTAKGEFEKEGMSGVSGHSHRLGAFYTTKRGGKYVWVESGCLCDLNPQYVEGVADWQNGISLVTFEGDHFHAEPLIIVENKMKYGGQTFRVH